MCAGDNDNLDIIALQHTSDSSHLVTFCEFYVNIVPTAAVPQ